LPEKAHGAAFVRLEIAEDEDGRKMDTRVITVESRKAYYEVYLNNTHPTETRDVKLYANVTEVIDGDPSNWTLQVFEYDGDHPVHLGDKIPWGTQVEILPLNSQRVVLLVTAPHASEGAALDQIATTEFYGEEYYTQVNQTEVLTFTTIIGKDFIDPELIIIGAVSQKIIPGDATDTKFKVQLRNLGAERETFSFLDSLTTIDEDSAAVRVERQGWIIVPRGTASVDLGSLESHIFTVGIRAPSYATYGPHKIQLFFGGNRGIDQSSINVTGIIPEPDLQITKDDIVFGRSPALHNQEIPITVYVFNAGSSVSQNVKVRILVKDELGAYTNVGEESLEGIGALQRESITISFTPDISKSAFVSKDGDGAKQFYLEVNVEVDPEGYVFESDTENNEATREVIVIEKSSTKYSYGASPIMVVATLIVVFIASMAFLEKKKAERN
jgi:hypothetical protein